MSIPAANLSGELPSSFVRLNATQTFTGVNTFASPGNSFSGAFTGNGGGLTNLNAESLTGSISPGRLSSVPAAALTGTIPSAALSGVNGGGLTSLNASSLVTGSVNPALLTNVPAANLSGNIPAARLNSVPAASLTGGISPALLTSVPAEILTGTLPLATIPGTLARVAADQAFSGANAFTNPANSFQGTFAGDGNGLTNLDAASLTGAVAPARLTSVPAGSLTGTVPAAALTGVSGAGLTNLNAANLTGTLPIASLPSNLVRLDTNQTFTGLMTFSNTSNVFNGSFTGNGAGLTNLNAANLTGAIAPARLTSVPAANVTGTIPIASIPVGVARTDGDQSYSGVNSFNNSQNFFRGSGADLTSLNATSITSGTISPNRLPSTVVRTDNNNAFGLFNNSFVSLSIGTTVSPARALQVGDVNVPGSTGLIRLESRASTGANQRAFDIGVVNGGTSDTGSNYSFVIADTNRGIANPDFMIRFSNGNVGLGTNNPTNRLTVNGNMNVTGSVAKGGGSFKIDHPLDPENKYLYHSFVESPDMMNIYNGEVTTDGTGYAVITLPDYFQALNRDFRYQLTVIDDEDQSDALVWAKVVRRIGIDGANTFTIRTFRPNVAVSWQVTGIRQDAWAEKNRIPNSVDKVGAEKGKYLHPEAFDRPTSQSMYSSPAAASQPASK